MRSVEVVKNRRDELRDQYQMFLSIRNAEFPKPVSYKELSKYDGALYSYLMSTMRDLTCQINALEFVLNEDSELRDVTWVSPGYEIKGVTKEKVLSLYEGNNYFY